MIISDIYDYYKELRICKSKLAKHYYLGTGIKIYVKVHMHHMYILYSGSSESRDGRAPKDGRR